MLVSTKIDPDKFIYFLRNKKSITNYVENYLKSILKSYDNLIINKSVLQNEIEYFKGELKKDSYTEKEKQLLSSIIAKLENLNSFIINDKLNVQIIYRSRFYFYPIFNLNTPLIRRLLNNGFISNLLSWSYLDIISAEFRFALILSKVFNRKLDEQNLYLIDELLYSQDIYSQVNNLFRVTYKRSVIKRILVITIHGGTFNNVNTKLLEFLEIVRPKINERLFTTLSQFFILHFISSLIDGNNIPFLLNYDGVYLVNIEK